MELACSKLYLATFSVGIGLGAHLHLLFDYEQVELRECTLIPENIVPATGKNLTNLTNTCYVNACVGVCCNNISQYFPSTYYDAWPFDKCLICTSSFNLVI